MELVYTDMSHDMTEILVKKASKAADMGKRVFYIAPNSLSFEKERAVLELLEKKASFTITITRFEQMARYFLLNKPSQEKSLNDAGLAMLFYRALSQLDDNSLPLLARLKKDPNFIKQLVDLYKELQAANLTILDLDKIPSTEKYQALKTIFLAFNDLLRQGHYDNQTKLSFFRDELASSTLDKTLSDTVVVIDGFTRFSAEEEELVGLLESKCHQVVIGTYISPKAQRATFLTGNVYQASLDFMRDLAQRFEVKPVYETSSWQGLEAFRELSQLFEANHDFTASGEQLSQESKAHVAIWQASNQKEEIEWVARAIRQQLFEGKRYKDILVLLGDVDAYSLQIKQIFEQYDIPHYIAKAESMSTHPLVNLISSLERLKRYHFRGEDVINLVTSGLYTRVSQADLDYFTHYISYADLKGRKAFFSDFTLSDQGKYHLERLNAIRKCLMEPLEQLMKARKQSGAGLLKKLIHFCEAIDLPYNMSRLVKDASSSEQEKEEQVWKTFMDLLTQFQTIFDKEKLALEECLSLLSAALLQADYRTVPATVDVVTIRSYDLVEPHTKPYVFALGMIQSNFPKLAKNRSLISDEERQLINDSVAAGRLDIVYKEASKKSHFTALSLFNAATESLVLTLPSLLNETADMMSPYLSELKAMGVPFEHKQLQKERIDATNIASYKALLSRLVDFANDSLALRQEMTKSQKQFWSVLVRYLRRKMAKEGIEMPLLYESVETTPVSKEAIEARFALDEALRLSSSALTTFYNNQYKYFLQYVLNLQEESSVHPDARHHGTYLHRVFELVMRDDADSHIDTKIEKAIKTVNQEANFKAQYAMDEEGRYSLSVLEDIARATASLFKRHTNQVTQDEEERFSWQVNEDIIVNGIIDRVDRLADGSLGVIDYKSSEQKFDIGLFYNGLNSQLVTYLAALKESYDLDIEQMFGAMYLHMQEPKLKLKDVISLEELQAKVHRQLRYTGLFLEDEKAYLADGNFAISRSTKLYSKDEIAVLLAYNKQLYQYANKAIRSGYFDINPYTIDDRSVKGDQLKAITGFEADRHMRYARSFMRFPKGKVEDYLDTMKVELEEEDDAL
ncbi:ATP-dependent nuclease subunit B [Streptococcus sp. zg-JUN1979]|uniref:ATP-dependent nuclease subunit B n=1 Tax=Streptococcus sp. zg-JUN1979 TaxID=3391450 RepID=UPI0039A42F55